MKVKSFFTSITVSLSNGTSNRNPRSRYLRSLFFLLSILLLGTSQMLYAGNDFSQNHIQIEDGCFELAIAGQPVPLYISSQDHKGAIRAMQDFSKDVERVTQTKPEVFSESIPQQDHLVIAGTIGKSPMIDQLIKVGKIDVSEVSGEWEAFLQQVVENPVPGVKKALVIAGSDKRGTIYGIYDLSKEIGVSPWYWWADVPVEQKETVSVMPECRVVDQPKVQYRGIFLNDENPALYGWVNETYGGFNHEFYSEVFELILRLKGNYLWPAMWGKAFYDDDPMNAVKADEYGIVIGTSHHEPMGRAHVEWERYGESDWNYQTNKETLQKFWAEGIERLKDYEATISLAMRGDGDEPMGEETNVELLQRIVKDQREIIDSLSPDNKDRQVQLWALYKEVQEYYEKGMRVPDDVMLLAADDNWGNVRLLPEPGTANDHPGGWGLYYHFDYVGGPRNYKWINTNQISRTWEQMNLVWEHGMDRMWLVNVGDLKPMEFPISFFLDHAWNPDEMTADDMSRYPEEWAAYQFGEKYGKEIGEFLTRYTQYNSRRTSEMLSPETYSLHHFNEAERIVKDYNALAQKAEKVYEEIPETYRDAYYQLVLFPILASANLNELYVATAKNRWYAEQGRALTNKKAERVKQLFERDSLLTETYHNDLANGKWNHMMSQTHIGYTYWQQPEKNTIPETETIEVPEQAEMGVSIVGTEKWWPNADTEAKLPDFDKFNKQNYYLEVFNRGATPFEYTAETDSDWLKVSGATGEVKKQERILVNVDWGQVPEGKHKSTITIRGEAGAPVIVYAEAFNPSSPQKENISGFVESNGYVAMEAEHFSRNIGAGDAEWIKIPELGRTKSAVTPEPVTAQTRSAGSDESPLLEYDLHLFSQGEVEVKVYLSPTLDYYMDHPGLRYGISFDDEEPQIINIHEDYNWYELVGNSINIKSSTHTIDEPGEHTLKIWMVDPGVVIQKIVVETENIGETYLGPPESFRVQD